MSAITWTRHEFTPIADATERQAWYEGIGLGDWFDITMSSSGADEFTMQPYTDGARLVLTWIRMGGSGSSREGLSTTVFYLAGASSSTALNMAKPLASPTLGKLSFDFATVGSVELLRMCTTNNNWAESQEIIFTRDTTTTVDGNTAHMVLMSCPMSNVSRPLAGTYLFMPDTTGSVLYDTSSNQNGIQYRKENLSYCDKFIIKPIVTLGVISHLYSIDGSPTDAPEGDVEFVLGSHVYYSLGHGMCVRVK